MDNLRSIGQSKEPTAISPQPSQQQKQLQILETLVTLAEARQAAVSAKTLELYSSELSRHQAEDIEAAVRKLMFRKREKGDTAFPDLATLEEEILAFAKIRRQKLAAEEERRQREAEVRHRLEHPEDYVHVRDIFADFMEKRALEGPKPPARATTACPYCNGVQLQSLKPADLRQLADALEKRAAAEETA